MKFLKNSQRHGKSSRKEKDNRIDDSEGEDGNAADSARDALHDAGAKTLVAVQQQHCAATVAVLHATIVKLVIKVEELAAEKSGRSRSTQQGIKDCTCCGHQGCTRW